MRPPAAGGRNSATCVALSPDYRRDHIDFSSAFFPPSSGSRHLARKLRPPLPAPRCARFARLGRLEITQNGSHLPSPLFFSSQEADPRSITFLINRLTEFQSTVQNSTGRVCPHFLLQSASRTVLAERQGPIRASHRRCDEATRARVHRHTRRAGQAVSDIGFFLF